MKELFESVHFGDENSPCLPYLFSTSSASIEFVIIEEEMAQLNDFSVLLLGSAKERLGEEVRTLQKLKSGELTMGVPEVGDVTDSAIMGLEQMIIPRWKDTVEFVSRATVLILLHIFLEKSLKQLCSDFDPDQPSKAPRQSKGQSKIDTYLDFLRSKCAWSFEEPLAIRNLRPVIARIRNDFAHGDWDGVRNNISEIKLREAFGAVTELFKLLEDTSERIIFRSREQSTND